MSVELVAIIVTIALALAAYVATLSAWIVRTLWRLDRRVVRIEARLNLDHVEGVP